MIFKNRVLELNKIFFIRKRSMQIEPKQTIIGAQRHPAKIKAFERASESKFLGGLVFVATSEMTVEPNDGGLLVLDSNKSYAPSKKFTYSSGYGLTDLTYVRTHAKKKYMYVSTEENKIHGLAAKDNSQFEAVESFTNHEDYISAVNTNDVDNVLLSASFDGTVSIWRLKDSTVLEQEYQAHSDRVLAAKWFTDHQTNFLTCGSDREVSIWDVRKPKNAAATFSGTSAINDIDFGLSDSNKVFACSQEGQLIELDIRAFDKKRVLCERNEAITKISIGKNELVGLSTSSYGFVVHELKNEKEYFSTVLEDSVTSVYGSKANQCFYVSTVAKKIHIFEF